MSDYTPEQAAAIADAYRYTPEQAAAIADAYRAAVEHRPQTLAEQMALYRAFGGMVPSPWNIVADPDQITFRRSSG